MAFQNLKKLKTKRDVQVFCGMLASLQAWNQQIAMSAVALRAATGTRGKFVWTEDMENEYQNLKEIKRKQLKLCPYNREQKLRLTIDGARMAGIF